MNDSTPMYCLALTTAMLLLPPCPQQKAASGTPLEVAGVKVIFYSPAPLERDSLLKVVGVEIGEVLDDFDYYTGKSLAFLKSWQIPFVFTTSREIKVYVHKGPVRSLDRTVLPDPTGVILTDGIQEPRVLYGVLTDEELIAEITEFYQLR